MLNKIFNWVLSLTDGDKFLLGFIIGMIIVERGLYFSF